VTCYELFRNKITQILIASQDATQVKLKCRTPLEQDPECFFKIERAWPLNTSLLLTSRKTAL